ncbi:MAG: carbamoyl phosphate synthetase [Pseudopedobacter saltans]|uniref:Carbamoyl phosphate synthetase n=1 Tax=Pseudopedobacter saltans TaxID=151895 RepID=A0A2W5EZ82_9SPHI|nr:MAG: carbamoyl phosphate synthetase [Pseudopedobacter saltans]
MKRFKIPKTLKCITATLILTTITIAVMAQTGDGAAGIEEATSKVKSYFSVATKLMYAIGAVVGIVGAIKVFNKWNSGDQDTNKVAAAWFGSCIFLVVVATVLKSFFGV